MSRAIDEVQKRIDTTQESLGEVRRSVMVAEMNIDALKEMFEKRIKDLESTARHHVEIMNMLVKRVSPPSCQITVSEGATVNIYNASAPS